MALHMSQDNEKEVQKVTKVLHIPLPFGSMPLPMKVLTLLTSAGGLSIVASIFSDIISPQETIVFFYLLRIVTGLLMLTVAYGLIKRKVWSLWLYGGIAAISFFINPVLSLLPIGITIYLYLRRSYLNNGGSLKEVYILVYNKVSSSFRKVKPLE